MHTCLLPPPGDLPLSPLCLKNDRDGSMHSTGRGSGGPALTPHLHVHLAASPNPNCSGPGFTLQQGAREPFKDCIKDLALPFCPSMPCVCLLHHYHPIKMWVCNNSSKTLPQSLCCLPKHSRAFPKSSFPFQLPQRLTIMLSRGLLQTALSRTHTSFPVPPLPIPPATSCPYCHDHHSPC